MSLEIQPLQNGTPNSPGSPIPLTGATQERGAPICPTEDTPKIPTFKAPEIPTLILARLLNFRQQIFLAF